jgi:hypothetical protein
VLRFCVAASLEDQLVANGNKQHRTQVNIYSMDCRTGGEAGGFSGLDGRRGQNAEGRKNDWS